MIVINNVVTRDDIPFKLNDIVRDNCVIITSIIGKIDWIFSLSKFSYLWLNYYNKSDIKYNS